MPPKLIELQPNRLLLNTEFNGYKLSLETIPTFKQELEVTVDKALPKPDKYSFLHAKLYGLHNHLIGETIDGTDLVYYINKSWNIIKTFSNVYESGFEELASVWEIPSSRERILGDYNISLKFPTEDLAVVGDGVGKLHILETGSRLQNLSWNCVFTEEVLGSEKSFLVLDSLCKLNDQQKQELHCLLYSIVCDDVGKHPLSALYWITLTKETDNSWGQTALREMQAKGDIYYAHLEPTCQAVYIVSDNSFIFTVDSERPIITDSCSNNVAPNKYNWSQTKESVIIKLKLPINFNVNDLLINTTSTEINIKYNELILLSGKLYREVHPNLTISKIENDMLIITLSKVNDHTWLNGFVSQGDENVCEDTVVDEVHERMAHLFNDGEVAPPPETAFSTRQTEECDYEEDKRILFERLSCLLHEASHRIHINSHKILLTVKLTNMPPAIALKHDVDACVWQPSSIAGDEWTLRHEGTLNAFAYVQASKQQRKFSVCSPNLSYSVVCESSRHIFIYRQQKTVTSGELRHRSTGRKVGTVAQQQVISLTNEEILGIYATICNLYLLTESCIYVLKIE